MDQDFVTIGLDLFSQGLEAHHNLDVDIVKKGPLKRIHYLQEQELSMYQSKLFDNSDF